MKAKSLRNQGLILVASLFLFTACSDDDAVDTSADQSSAGVQVLGVSGTTYTLDGTWIQCDDGDNGSVLSRENDLTFATDTITFTETEYTADACTGSASVTADNVSVTMSEDGTADLGWSDGAPTGRDGSALPDSNTGTLLEMVISGDTSQCGSVIDDSGTVQDWWFSCADNAATSPDANTGYPTLLDSSQFFIQQ